VIYGWFAWAAAILALTGAWLLISLLYLVELPASAWSKYRLAGESSQTRPRRARRRARQLVAEG
jgi:hypothetical protein